MDLKRDFYKWIEVKTGKVFSIENEITIAIIDDNIQLMSGAINANQANQAPEEIFRELLLGCRAALRLVLEGQVNPGTVRFQQIEIPQDESKRLRVLNEFLQLCDLCLN